MTMYAPVKRACQLDIWRQYHYFEKESSVKDMLNAISALVVVVNKERQLVYANKAVLDLFALENLTTILGKRPGEVFCCIHAYEGEGGCGTSEVCENCGAVNVILKVISNRQTASHEVCLNQEENKMLNLKVFGSYYAMQGEDFYIITFMDISDSQRKLALERIFFHDMINISGGLSGLLSLLVDDVDISLKEEVLFLDRSFKGLVEEIIAQKQLLEAENDMLIITKKELSVLNILEVIQKIYRLHKVANRKEIQVVTLEKDSVFYSDYALIKRILGNMLKNALEETPPGGVVKMGCDFLLDKQIRFWVHNEGVITLDIQNKIFERFFSTKGKGRGVGTYSMKLLGEKYLKGKVGFSSDEKRGTIFYFVLSLEEGTAC